MNLVWKERTVFLIQGFVCGQVMEYVSINETISLFESLQLQNIYSFLIFDALYRCSSMHDSLHIHARTRIIQQFFFLVIDLKLRGKRARIGVLIPGQPRERSSSIPIATGQPSSVEGTTACNYDNGDRSRVT